MLIVQCVNYFMDKKRHGNMSREIVLLSKYKTNKNNEKENTLFPNYYMICVSIKVGGKKKFAKNILTLNEDYHVKGAA